MRRRRLAAALVLGLTPALAAAQSVWRLEAGLGAAHSFDSPLTIDQPGSAPIEIDATWAGRAFESPPYYAWRLARQQGTQAWALRFIHLKAHLENTTPEVTRFAVSHGYNLLTLERGFERGGFWLWLGAGLVIAHPESTVRGLTRPEDAGGPFGGGYFLTGPTAALAVGRRLPLAGRFALLAEGRFALSRARVPVAEGSASVPNASLHALLGLELRL